MRLNLTAAKFDGDGNFPPSSDRAFLRSLSLPTFPFAREASSCGVFAAGELGAES